MAREIIETGYTPTPLTDAIHESPARFKVIDCGRRFGKSFCGVFEVAKVMNDVLERGSLARGLILSPTTPLLREDWQIAETLFAVKGVLLARHLTEMRLELSCGSLEFKSADSEAGVGRGAGYDIVLFDEASRIPEPIWEQEIRPALSDRRGKAVFISTPLGRNWFYDLWRKGNGDHPEHDPHEWMSWRYATIDGWRALWRNDPERLAQAEAEWSYILRTTSERTLRQEYLADFLEQEGSLWSLMKCLRGNLREAVPGRTYIAGIDIARAENWMVAAVFEVESRQLVGLHRSRHRNWDLQKATILQLLRQYPNVHALIDSTGVGSPISNDFRNVGLSIEDVLFTARMKKNLVDNLGVALDHGLIGLPDVPQTQWLLDELRAYREWTTDAGNIRWGAPEGKHDDGVVAVMLACWGMRFDFQQPYTVEEKPRDFTGFLPEELMTFTDRTRKWERAYPTLASPKHPFALKWQSHKRWKGLLHAD